MAEYNSTYFRTLKEERRNLYLFEHGNRTHNKFLLTATELQNFHIRLVSRNYTWNTVLEEFEITENPYSLPDESLWTLSLMINEI